MLHDWCDKRCLWDSAYKRSLADFFFFCLSGVAWVVAAMGFLSCYPSGPLPYVLNASLNNTFPSFDIKAVFLLLELKRRRAIFSL